MYSILLLTFVVFVLMCILNLLEVPLTCFSDSLFLCTVFGFRKVCVNLYKQKLNVQKEKKKGLPVVKLCTECSVPPLINVGNTF